MVRTRALGIASENSTESMDSSSYASFKNGQMVDIFGETFAVKPEIFEFRRGDIVFIKAIAAHVKQLVDGHGYLSGLRLFKEQRKKNDVMLKVIPNEKSKRKPLREGITFDASSEVIDSSAILLRKADLFEKVQKCFQSYGIDITMYSNSYVGLDKNSKIGQVQCPICETEDGIEQKVQRVYYSQTESRSSYWVLSNLSKHLEKKHLLVAHRLNKRQKTVAKKKSANKNVSIEIVKQELERDHNESSLQIIYPEVDDSSVQSLYTQISDQMTQMVATVLVNGENQDEMEFRLLKDSPIHTLNVVETVPDGNCLFSALTHQIWKHPISSLDHIDLTKKLRADVCEYILKPKNFPLYETALKLRVNEIEAKIDVTDFAAECELFVRHDLSQDFMCWGGLETIKAVSNMHHVNVAVFNEESTCYMISDNLGENKQTIVIAYRLGLNAAGESVLNHYDSVTDMNSDSMFVAAEHILKK